MMRIQLLEGIEVSRLAFGCAPVMGKIGKADSLKAMSVAYDAGITHFDVARSYGFGEAEGVLGAFVRGKRDRVTIATKFGIRAARTAGALRLVKPLVRKAASWFPGLKRVVRKASAHTLVAGNYTLDAARGSLEDSLRELRTDYVDILFIHDCGPASELSDELLAWLENSLSAGKIRAWGIATQRRWIDELASALRPSPRLVQCEQNLFEEDDLQCVEDGRPAIFHSPFGGATGADRVRELRLRLPPACRDELPDTPQDLSRLLLEYAIRRAGPNAVLCSMFNPAHIAANVQAVSRPRYSHELMALLASARRGDVSLHQSSHAG
jgi:aryl-alcohol dehydrogenase-like predicted oxidoreductase